MYASSMGYVRLIPIGLIIGLILVLSRIALAPIQVMLYVGSLIGMFERSKITVVVSAEHADQFREDMIKEMADGTRRILEHYGVESLAASRHAIRRNGLSSVRQRERDLTEGELLMNAGIVLIGLAASTATAIPQMRRFITAYVPVDSLAVLSLGTATVGAVVLIILFIRETIVRALLYDDGDLSVGRSEEILSKSVWNMIVVGTPSKALRAYYILYFANLIGEDTYAAVRSVLSESLDPTTTKRGVLNRQLSEVVHAIFRDMGVAS